MREGGGGQYKLLDKRKNGEYTALVLFRFIASQLDYSRMQNDVTCTLERKKYKMGRNCKCNVRLHYTAKLNVHNVMQYEKTTSKRISHKTEHENEL